jgi:hypothetical protein
MIKEESQFIGIHNKIATKSTHRQSQAVWGITFSQVNDNYDEKSEQATSLNPIGKKKEKKNKFKRSLISTLQTFKTFQT